MRQRFIPLLAILFLPLHAGAADRRGTGDDLLGTPAPPLALEHWINSDPLKIDDLAGRVVLVRWWTDTCPFCFTTAPVLGDLQETYGERGLQVIGIFHPKPGGDWDVERMRRAAEKFAFGFPVGLDGNWAALDRWWLDGRDRGWTSVSFLLDRDGTIRWVHPGGEYHPGNGGQHWPDHATCNREYGEVVAAIEKLLDAGL